MGEGDPIDPARHVAAVEAYSSQKPELYVQDDEAKAEYNGDAWDTNPDLLWTQDNEAFYKLVGAKEGGGKDRAIDTSLDDWLAQAHATNSFVQRSGLFLLNHNRKREFVPLVPKHILAAAVAGDSDVRFATTHAFGPVNHLAMSLMMLYSGLFNKASVYQLIIEKSQLKLFEEANRGDTQAVAEAYVLRHAVDQIIEWRTKATRGLLRPSSNIWQYTLLNDVTDQVTVHQFRISPFFHPNSKLNQKLTKARSRHRSTRPPGTGTTRGTPRSSRPRKRRFSTRGTTSTSTRNNFAASGKTWRAATSGCARWRRPCRSSGKSRGHLLHPPTTGASAKPSRQR